MFSEPFMQRALLAACFLGPVCAVLGVFVTARRMSFFSETISHGALTGVALGVWWGVADPTLPMVGFSLLLAIGIFYLREKTELLTDTIMALLLSGSVALGIVMLSLMKSRPGDIHAYLFGDILAIAWKEVWMALLLFLAGMTWIARNLSALTLLTANEEMAHVCGVPIRRLNLVFLVALTLTVALAIRLLGIVLVTALIVIPPAAARNLSINLRQHLVTSFLLGSVAGSAGVAASYYLDTPCGPTIVLACIALFLAAFLAGRPVRSVLGRAWG